MRLIFLLLACVPCPASATQQPDTSRLYANARTKEAAYERALRRFAPLRSGPQPGKSCDEVVGRWCLYYDRGRDTLPTEPAVIGQYRDSAIAAWAGAFRANRARVSSVFPLVRLLLAGRRPEDALKAAEEFADLSSDVATRSMLLGLTRHWSGDIPGAEAAFVSWLKLLEPWERSAIISLEPLLNRPEWKRVRTLPEPARSDYTERYWRFADALYLTGGNEIWTDHLARHAEMRLLKTVPVVIGSSGWDDDLAALAVRYGSPRARTRSWPAGMGSAELQIVEHYDPEQLTYASPALDSVAAILPRPRMGWPMDTIRSISGHAPPTFRRMVPLEHQVSIFPRTAGALVKAEAALLLDDSARGATAAAAALFLLDSAFNIMTTAPAQLRFTRDSIFQTAETRLPAEARYYSLEILEPGSRLAGRARFPITRPAMMGRLQLSDLSIGDPDLVIASGARIEVLGEISTTQPLPRQVRVELEVTASDGKPVLLRAASWVGRRLGLGGRAPARMSWLTELGDGPLTPVTVSVDPGRLKRGRYRLRMVVIDPATGEQVASSREIYVY